MRKVKPNHKIVMTSIICITILEGVALFKGVNGVLLTSVIGVIAGLAGWVAPQLKVK